MACEAEQAALDAAVLAEIAIEADLVDANINAATSATLAAIDAAIVVAVESALMNAQMTTQNAQQALAECQSGSGMRASSTASAKPTKHRQEDALAALAEARLCLLKVVK